MNTLQRFALPVLLMLLAFHVPGCSQGPRADEAREHPPEARVTVMVPEQQRIELEIDGVTRVAYAYVPRSAGTVPTPVVLAFHGHNGTAVAAARDYGMQRAWPEAITVYLQGLNTPGRFIDPEGKETGWQMQPGNQGDRDLKFFDAVLEHLRAAYKVDEDRVYALGHSGGGYFVYLLWAQRGDVLAGVAPMSSEAAENLPELEPMPALLLAGEQDGAVRYAWIRVTMDAVRVLNGCSAEGEPWAEHCTLFPSEGGTPLVEYVHPGGHEVPRGAIPAIARFFQTAPER